ncbi:MAG: carboxypeptidase-like regulatory domain-containing protein, partial [Chitinophagaceae bacterium]|nr:carboxypeptidase-like regulatory domain-containing protein [Chitinophagaceae bacterium]
MAKNFILSITLIFFSIVAFAQTNSAVLLGKVVDAHTGAPLSYATISLTAGGLNTMSNENGNFIFKFSAYSGNDSIKISHVGYQSVLLSSKARGSVAIELQKEDISLEAVTVKAVSALDLVKKAIARIPENYPSSPYLFNGFYRLTGSRESDIIQMSEAVFDIFSENYARKGKQMKLLKVRTDKDRAAFNGNDQFAIGSTAEDIMDHDIVSNVSESDILNKKQLNNYKFTYKGIIDYKGAEAYKIDFDQKDGIKKCLKQGTIIIGTEDMAFLEFKFWRSAKGL